MKKKVKKFKLRRRVSNIDVKIDFKYRYTWYILSAYTLDLYTQRKSKLLNCFCQYFHIWTFYLRLRNWILINSFHYMDFELSDVHMFWISSIHSSTQNFTMLHDSYHLPLYFRNYHSTCWCGKLENHSHSLQPSSCFQILCHCPAKI